ncbi:hypothetical protein C0J52_02321 [Blattella germanica]|nr:hypothetical protein C0J52_02321 [Blattella germanica]
MKALRTALTFFIVLRISYKSNQNCQYLCMVWLQPSVESSLNSWSDTPQATAAIALTPAADVLTMTSLNLLTHCPIIERNLGYDRLYRLTVSQILSGEIRDTPKDIAPNHIHLFKYAPVTSCEVERSFSLYKNIICDRRQNLTPENMEKYPVAYSASCHD